MTGSEIAKEYRIRHGLDANIQARYRGRWFDLTAPMPLISPNLALPPLTVNVIRSGIIRKREAPLKFMAKNDAIHQFTRSTYNACMVDLFTN